MDSPQAPTPAELALELVEDLDAMVAYWDLDRVCRFANRAYLEWFGKTKAQQGEVFFTRYWMESLGYAPAEVPRTAAFWESLIHPDDLRRVRAAIEEHFAGRSTNYECVNRLRRKDGSWRWNLDHGRVVERSKEGKPLRMVGTDSDLSAQHWSGLTQFIPICAGCKKIRHEDGSWELLEKHFGEGSRAQFTHGICEECVRKYYGHLPDE